MAGLLHLIPRYLPRFGMASQWVCYRRPLVVVLFVINLIVTLIFWGDVERQGGAYATGVLVLILSAAVAAAISTWREAQENRESRGKARPKAIYFWICAAVFAYTLVMNIRERADGPLLHHVLLWSYSSPAFSAAILTKQQSPTTRAFQYLVFGTGGTGFMVLEILTNY
jgi:hypothetical protein